MSTTNAIEREVFIRAPRSRVWRALTDIREFCTWFHAESNDPAFAPGARIHLASTYPGPYKGVTFYLDVVAVEPEHTFSWNWHPGIKQAGEDTTGEPPTLVEFRLKDAEGGTVVTVNESGFDLLFESRRARVRADNEGGWTIQMAALESYLS